MLYEYAVIKQPKFNNDGEEVEPAVVLVPPTTELASNPDHITLRAARALPDDETDNFDRIDVLIRPFA
jgi:hypothetical protein